MLNSLVAAGLGGAISRAAGGDFFSGALSAGLEWRFNEERNADDVTWDDVKRLWHKEVQMFDEDFIHGGYFTGLGQEAAAFWDHPWRYVVENVEAMPPSEGTSLISGANDLELFAKYGTYQSRYLRWKFGSMPGYADPQRYLVLGNNEARVFGFRFHWHISGDNWFTPWKWAAPTRTAIEQGH
jgi:hypothetical protein